MYSLGPQDMAPRPSRKESVSNSGHLGEAGGKLCIVNIPRGVESDYNQKGIKATGIWLRSTLV